MRPKGHKKTIPVAECHKLILFSFPLFSSRLHALSVSICILLSDPTEKVNLQVLSPGSIKEGDNVTLKCQADGNPPPTSFNFHIKVRTNFPQRSAPLGPIVHPVNQRMESFGSTV